LIETRSDKKEHYIFLDKEGFENAFASRAEPEDIAFEGPGIPFARCIRKNLDAGKLLKLYKKDGIYYVEEM
tara:strand:- start:156 stop:368 length:213 start_codon:yes stop_codon:yes gene_type:complete